MIKEKLSHAVSNPHENLIEIMLKWTHVYAKQNPHIQQL